MRKLILLLWLGFATTAIAQQAINIDVPGARQTQAFGINNIGQVVGYYQAGDGSQHAFVRDYGASYLELNYPGARLTMATGINDAGTIVGCYEDANGATHGFIVDHGGQYRSIDVDGASLTLASGINNHNQVVGYYSRGGQDHGFLWNDEIFTGFDFPQAGSATAVLGTYPAGINDSGDIVGSYLKRWTVVHLPDLTIGFVWVAKEQHFATAAGITYPVAINNQPLPSFVGYYTTNGRDAGLFARLMAPSYMSPFSQAIRSVPDASWRQVEWAADYALGINDAKMVVGYYVGADNRSHGFMFDCGKCY